MKKNTDPAAENVHAKPSLFFFLTQERAFIVFNSLPGKLIFKTLLWSLFIIYATFKNNDANSTASNELDTPSRSRSQPPISERFPRLGPTHEAPPSPGLHRHLHRDAQENLLTCDWLLTRLPLTL